jgi:hypothetical protein
VHPFGHRTKFLFPLATKLNFTDPFNVLFQSQNKTSRTPLVTEQNFTHPFCHRTKLHNPFGYRRKLHKPLYIRMKLKYPMSSSAIIHIPLGLRMGYKEPLDLKSGTSITYDLKIKLHVHLATRLKLHTPSSDLCHILNYVIAHLSIIRYINCFIMRGTCLFHAEKICIKLVPRCS